MRRLLNATFFTFTGAARTPMMEKNNAEVADVVHKWLARKELVD